MPLQRLRRSRDIRALYRTGRRLTTDHLRIFWSAASGPDDCLTIIISNKISKQSSQRNRWRRILRECIRSIHSDTPAASGHALVLLVRSRPADEDQLLKECRWIFARAFHRQRV